MYLFYRTTGLKISGFTLSDLYMTKLTKTSFFLHCTAYTYIFACAMRSVFVCSCILCVKSVVWGFPCVTGVDHNFMSHFISLTLTHWTLHESMIQVGSQKKKKKKNLRYDVMEFPSRAQPFCEWGQSSGKPMKKLLVRRIGTDCLALPCWIFSENHKAKVSALPAQNRPPRFTCIVELQNEIFIFFQNQSISISKR